MIYTGNCLDILPTLEAESVDSIVTDPPYGLSFMGKSWDHGVPGAPFWEAALRVAKPGAFLLAFGGTRTFHRLAVAIEDAGWEIRDTVMWVYGSGFPKSLDVSKAIDKAAGAERQVVGVNENGSGPHRIKLDNHGKGDTGIGYMDGSGKVFDITAPATDTARQWEGWGTALKPAWEPVLVCRKPLIGTVAANVLKYGTGAMNIDGCRVGAEDIATRGGGRASTENYRMTKEIGTVHQGRWPANLIHDGSEEVVGLFPQSKSCNTPSNATPESKFRPGQGNYQPQGQLYPGDSGSAARFFYCAKSSRSERGEGNTHPTVKPTALMRYLCRLVTPSGGIVLDPFMGSGSTGKAAMQEGFRFIGIELNPGYIEMAEKRIEAVKMPLFE